MKKSLFVAAFLAACISFFIEDLVVPDLVEARNWTNRSKEVDSYKYDAQGVLVRRSHERRDNQPRGGYYYSPAPVVYHYPPPAPVHRVPRCEDYIGPSHPDYYRVCGGGHGHFPGHGGYEDGVWGVLSPELTICLFCVKPSTPVIRERIIEERPVILERERVIYRDREVVPAPAPMPEPRRVGCRAKTPCVYVTGGSAEARAAVELALQRHNYSLVSARDEADYEVEVSDRHIGDPTAVVGLRAVRVFDGGVTVAEGRATYRAGSELQKDAAIRKAAEEAVRKL